MRKLYQKILRELRKLTKVRTWLQPKSLLVLVVAVVIIDARGLLVKWLEIQLEDYAKTSTISVEYLPIETTTVNQLGSWTRSNGLKEFSLKLDDGILKNYSIVPFNIKNPSRNPIGSLSFELNLGNYVRILDAQIITRTPRNITTLFRTKLPSEKWRWPSNTVQTYLSWDHNPDAWVNVYTSIDRDRGFGKVSPGFCGEYVVLPFAPTDKLLRWYVKLSSENNSWGEVFGDKAIRIPNPSLTVAKFENSGDATNPPAMLKTANDFLNGRTELIFVSGLEKDAEVSMFVLCKALDGESISPSLSLKGAHGVAIKELNTPQSISIPESDNLDKRRINLMPEMVQAYPAGKQVVLFWEVPTNTSYTSVKVFRSPGRAIGDYSEIGTNIYEGFGVTNQFTIETWETESPVDTNSAARRFDQYFSPPTQPSLSRKVVSVPSPMKPEPPSNLRVASVLSAFNGALHYADTPPERDTVYTYTIYAFDAGGSASYPIVVNASLHKTTENWVLRVIK